MPYFVGMIRIDWHVEEASPALQRVLPAANADLDSPDHTYETFEERLTHFAQAHSDARALVEDGFRVRWFFHVRGGEIEVRHVYPVLAEVDHDELIDGIEPEYETEADLIAAVEDASNAQASGEMVADVGRDRYLVRLAGGGAEVHKAYAVDPALFDRLLDGTYVRPPG